MPKVYILILHWQKYDITKKCLDSFKELDYPNYKIIVLDNASDNDSARVLEKEFPENIFIFNKENNGYGAGMNPGIEYALKNGADYIFLLNNDVVVNQPDFLLKLVDFMESNKKIGISGPKLLFDEGSYQKSYNNFFLAMVLEPWWPAKMTTLLRKTGLSKSKENDVCKVAWLNAVALLFRKEVFEGIGLMDERFFLGAEDIDLSLRAKKRGWETWYYPKAELMHESFVSHKKTAISYDKFYAISTVQFIYKHYFILVAIILHLLMTLGFFLRGLQWLIISMFKKNKRNVAWELFKMCRLVITALFKL